MVIVFGAVGIVVGVVFILFGVVLIIFKVLLLGFRVGGLVLFRVNIICCLNKLCK